MHSSSLSISAGRLLAALTVLALVGVTAGCGKPKAVSVSADTWATVDGRSIMRDDVDKAFRRTQVGAVLSPEETLTLKLSLLNEMILQDILIAKAQALKIVLTDSELDAAYAEAKKNVTDAAFEAEMKKRNLSTADMRDGVRRELLAKKLLDQEVVAKVAVTDQEINEFFNANRAQFTVAEESYRLAQIVITPERAAQQTNRTGNDATTPEEAAFKVRMIMERLKGGASFAEVAMEQQAANHVRISIAIGTGNNPVKRPRLSSTISNERAPSWRDNTVVTSRLGESMTRVRIR